MLGELVAAGGADLKALAVHIRTADANPDEIQVRLALLCLQTCMACFLCLQTCAACLPACFPACWAGLQAS